MFKSNLKQYDLINVIGLRAFISEKGKIDMNGVEWL